MVDLLFNKGCCEVPLQKMGLLWIDNQYLCQVSETPCQSIHLSDMFRYLKNTSIPVRALMVI